MNKKYMYAIVLSLLNQAACSMQCADGSFMEVAKRSLSFGYGFGELVLSRPLLHIGMQTEYGKRKLLLDECGITDIAAAAAGTACLGLGSKVLCDGAYKCWAGICNAGQDKNSNAYKLRACVPLLVVGLSCLRSAFYTGQNWVWMNPFTSAEGKLYTASVGLALNGTMALACLEQCAKLFPFKR